MSETSRSQSLRPIFSVFVLFVFSLILLLSGVFPREHPGSTEFLVVGTLLLILSTILIMRQTHLVVKSAHERSLSDINMLKKLADHNEGRFEAITEQSSDGITVADVDGNYTFVNPAFCKMMGYNAEELLKMTVFDVKAPEQDHSSFERTKTSNQGEPFEVVLQRKDGTTFIAEVVGNNIIVEDQHQVLGTVRDITDQVRSEERTRTLYQAVEQSPVSIMIMDTDGLVQYVNPTMESKTGFSLEDILGKSLESFFTNNSHTIPYSALWSRLSQSNSWEGEIETQQKNGSTFFEYAYFSPVKDIYGKTIQILAVKEDISLRKRQEEKILQQAHFDTLTGLPNRFLSLDRLDHTILEAKRHEHKSALLFIDLDDFKKVNDTLGHETGDQLLIEAANRLSAAVREEDTVGRLGGDEFVVILSTLDEASDARIIAENLIERFRTPYKIDGRELLLTASVGIAIYPDDGNNVSLLLRNSDSAMYHAKAQGRNSYAFFTDEMNREVSRRLAIEEQINNALTRNEFKVVYQPIIDVNSKSIVGAEALLRWQNPALGSVSPEEFIPIAEQTGIIVPIGEYVLTQALNKASYWQDTFNPSFRIAINLSPRQFRDPELVRVIQNAMTNSHVNNATLELEITEGVLLNGYSQVHNALSALNSMNVNIAMDDFGTGYSSLSYLRNYPFDVLKIDRSFVHDISTDPSDRQLIKAAIAMAHGLGLKVVAEGVETEDQLAYLSDLHCDFAQGFLFGKPLSDQELTALLTDLKQ